MPDGTDSEASPRQSRSRMSEVYDEIAGHFSQTRAYPWPEIETFLEATTVDAPAVGLDIGCGNGRHTELLAAVTETAIGLDVSRELLGEARQKMAADGWAGPLLQGDAARLPLADDSVGVAIYVATLHHLPERATRRESLSELARVLAPGGQALVSAWSTAHDRFDERDGEGFDTTIDWTLPGGETVPRFYHIYGRSEFERDIESSGLTISDSRLSSGNCYATVTV